MISLNLDKPQFWLSILSLDRLICFCNLSPSLLFCPGGRGSSAVERATPGEEVPGSIPAVAARSLLVGSVSV